MLRLMGTTKWPRCNIPSLILVYKEGKKFD
jgi:hypothetical protein